MKRLMISAFAAVAVLAVAATMLRSHSLDQRSDQDGAAAK